MEGGEISRKISPRAEVEVGRSRLPEAGTQVNGLKICVPRGDRVMHPDLECACGGELCTRTALAKCMFIAGVKLVRGIHRGSGKYSLKVICKFIHNYILISLNIC